MERMKAMESIGETARETKGLAAHAELLLGDKIEDCNEAAAALFGGSREALLGRCCSELMPSIQADGSVSQPGFLQRVEAARAGLPQCFTWQLRGLDGRSIDALVDLEPNGVNGSAQLLMRVRDLSGVGRTEQALEETEARLRQVLENTSAVVFLKDFEGNYLYVNQRFCEMFGRTEAELLRSRDEDVFPAHVAARLRADDRSVFEARGPLEFEENLIVGGKPCVYLAIKFPLINQAGQPYAVCGIATDITRRKRTEEALRSAALAVSSAEGEGVYQGLTRYLATTLGVECAFIAVCTNDESTHVRTLAVYTDSGFEDNIEYALPGTACGSVVGQDFRFVPSGVRDLYPEDRTFARLGIDAYAAYPLNGADGRALGLIAVLSRNPLTDPGLTESMLKIFATRAVSEIERQIADEARRTSEESYRAIFEATEDAIFVHDWDSGAVVDVNPTACERYGYSHEEMKQLGVADISSGIPPYTPEERARYLEQAKRSGPVRFEWHRKNRDGSLHWDEVCLKPAVIAGQRRVLAFTREITQRKQLEDALRSAAMAVSSVEGDSVFRDLTRQLAATLNVDIAFIARFAPDDPTRMGTLACWIDGAFIRNYEYALKGTPCEGVVGREFLFLPRHVQQLFDGGGMHPIGVESYAAFPLFDTQGRSLGLIALAHRKPMKDPALVESVLKIFAARAASEIERKDAEEELRSSEAQYRAIFNTTADSLVLRDSTFRVVDVNAAYVAMTGFTREDVLGSDSIFSNPPAVHAEIRRLHSRVLAGEPLLLETQGVHRDGTVFEVEVRGVPIHHQGRPHVLYIGRNITARKRAEAERAQLEAQLRQAQKMEAIGHLTGGIAHDFNNILTSIMGYVVLATERQSDLGDSKLGKYLEQAHLAATRARDLIQQMLTFSRGRRGEPRALSLPPLVRETVKLLRSTLPSTIEMETELRTEVPPVLLDPVHIEQVLLNLCINARDATNGSGKIRVSVRLVDEIEHTCTSCRQPVRGQGMVELAVRDTGSGIAPEVIDRMFEPFFSTKEVGKGSGMGLATVHGIVHEHGGHVVVETALGRGTDFRVLFVPLARQKSDQHAATDRARSPARKPVHKLSGRVLVVDDEEMVGEFMGDLLANWGLEVTVINSAPEARDIFTRDPGHFDLVLTDQTMPKLTGLELAGDIRTLRPDVPVVLYTGYSENIRSAQLAEVGVRALVKKPIDPPALFAVLRKYLGHAKKAARSV